MIEFIGAHPIAAYITIAIAFAIIELRLEPIVHSSDEAFWMTMMIAFLFPIALVRRTYIVIGKAILWVVTFKRA